MTREQIRDQLSDQAALICTLFGEAANEPIDGQVAVASVIRNRVQHPRWWGSGWKAVCLRHVIRDGRAIGQFSCWWERNQNTDRVYALASALLTRQTADPSPTTLSQLRWVAIGVMDNSLLDPTESSDHYLTTKLLKTAPPPWARTGRKVGAIAAHTFFRLEI